MKPPEQLPNADIAPELDDQHHLPDFWDAWWDGDVRITYWAHELGRPRFCWTTTRTPAGFFLSLAYRPHGDPRLPYALDLLSIRRHRRRKDAKERALRLQGLYREPDRGEATDVLGDLLGLS